MLNKKGFTLVEVLLVIVILGIIAAIVIPRITDTQASAKAEANKANKAAINSQAELYYSREGTCPPASATADTSNKFWTNTSYFPEGVPNDPVTNTTYSIDTTTCRVTGH